MLSPLRRSPKQADNLSQQEALASHVWPVTAWSDFFSILLESGSRQIGSMVKSLEAEATRLENAVQDLGVV